MGHKDLITLAQAQAQAGTNYDPSNLRVAVRAGKLKGIKIGDRWLTTLAWFQDWLWDPEAHKFDPLQRNWLLDKQAEIA